MGIEFAVRKLHGVEEEIHSKVENIKEKNMFSVSEKAQEMIKKALESREEKIPVRLVYSAG